MRYRGPKRREDEGAGGAETTETRRGVASTELLWSPDDSDGGFSAAAPSVIRLPKGATVTIWCRRPASLLVSLRRGAGAVAREWELCVGTRRLTGWPYWF